MILSGEEADELFEGYPTYLGHRHAGRVRALPGPLRRALPSPEHLRIFLVLFAAGAAGLRPKEMIRIDRTSGWAKREGRWLVPPRIEVRVKSGHITLDFTEAVITQPLLQIDADVGSGMLTLVTKPGIVVDADDVAVSSGGVKVRAPWGPDVPVILRVEVTGRVRSGHLRARPPRRTFWQWLLRRPRPYQPAAP